MAAFLLAAAPDALSDAILLLTGASSVEELDEQVIERFSALSERPIDINRCGRSRLLSSGLLSEYQVVSLLDYRSRSGDILSWTELGLIDGFSPAIAEALSQFCSLKVPGSIVPPKTVAAHGELMVRSAVKVSDDDDVNCCYGAKCNIEIGEMVEVNWGSRTTYSDGRFGPGTASIAMHGRDWKAMAGDFNARYGQGLFQWSGFSLGSYSSVTAMQRKATGLSASKSFTRTLHGAGADLDIGKWNVGGAWSWPGTGMVHGSRYGKNITAGATALYSKDGGLSVSADWRAGAGNLCFYGESGWNSKTGPGVLAGLMHSPSYGVRDALMIKWLSNTFQSVAGYQGKIVTSTIDAIWKKSYKALLIVKPSIAAGNFIFVPGIRIQFKYRADDPDLSRLDIRAEGSTEWREHWVISGRYDWVSCKDGAWLWYAEGGYKSSVLTSYLRFTLFKVDNWDDRIWVYERDAPGNFNVPAYYGRGFATSAVVSYKRKKQCLHLRAGTVMYPWNLQYKSPKTEIKLQYQLKL